MAKEFTRGLVWLRADLRLTDQTALAAATRQCAEVYLIFVFDKNILKSLRKDDKRVSFIWDCLKELQAALKESKSLRVAYGDPVDIIPHVALKLGAKAVYTNEDYEPQTIKRDVKTCKKLQKEGILFNLYKDSVIFHKDEIIKPNAQPYRVFTPYKRKWLETLAPLKKSIPDLKVLKKWPKISGLEEPKTLSGMGFSYTPCDEIAGEKGAAKRLRDFVPCLKDYHLNRDYPAVDGTSYLSMHLRFGTISIRTLVQIALDHGKLGGDTWLNELIWRDFFKMILYKYPHVVAEPFNMAYKNLIWENNSAFLKAWKNGETGFPIVDAAMRKFNRTGRMHNRLRMVVAQFLTKDFLVHWKYGEDYFAEGLLDYDLSANSGGWQWSASVGCDAQPYFRIFNPWLQSKKFDPDGEFIKSEIKELSYVEPKALHDPKKLELARVKGYPRPVVDHSVMRKKALLMFKA